MLEIGARTIGQPVNSFGPWKGPRVAVMEALPMWEAFACPAQAARPERAGDRSTPVRIAPAAQSRRAVENLDILDMTPSQRDALICDQFHRNAAPGSVRSSK
jgi:hypothetical protein